MHSSFAPYGLIAYWCANYSYILIGAE